MFDLTTRPFDTQVLEAPEERLCDEILEPPAVDIPDNDTSIPECPRPNTNVPVFCSKS